MFILTVVRVDDPETPVYTALCKTKAKAEEAAERYRDNPAVVVTIEPKG